MHTNYRHLVRCLSFPRPTEYFLVIAFNGFLIEGIKVDKIECGYYDAKCHKHKTKKHLKNSVAYTDYTLDVELKSPKDRDIVYRSRI